MLKNTNILNRVSAFALRDTFSPKEQGFKVSIMELSFWVKRLRSDVDVQQLKIFKKGRFAGRQDLYEAITSIYKLDKNLSTMFCNYMFLVPIKNDDMIINTRRIYLAFEAEPSVSDKDFIKKKLDCSLILVTDNLYRVIHENTPL